MGRSRALGRMLSRASHSSTQTPSPDFHLQRHQRLHLKPGNSGGPQCTQCPLPMDRHLADQLLYQQPGGDCNSEVHGLGLRGSPQGLCQSYWCLQNQKPGLALSTHGHPPEVLHSLPAMPPHEKGTRWAALVVEQFSTNFCPGHGPRDLGSSPTSGFLHGACFSLCLCLCLSLSLSLS